MSEQRASRFAERIRIPSRLLAPGARQQGVSVSTVVAAYDPLLAQGLVVAQKNSGFSVREGAVYASNRHLAQVIPAQPAIKNIATPEYERAMTSAASALRADIPAHLREPGALSQKLGAIDAQAGPEQITTTIDATHALGIVSRTLLRAGDCVMVEEPGWADEFARLDALGMRIFRCRAARPARIWT